MVELRKQGLRIAQQQKALLAAAKPASKDIYSGVRHHGNNNGLVTGNSGSANQSSLVHHDVLEEFPSLDIMLLQVKLTLCYSYLFAMKRLYQSIFNKSNDYDESSYMHIPDNLVW